MLLLSEAASGEHLCYEVKSPFINIDPRRVVSHYGGVIEVFEKMDLGIESLKLLR